MSLDAKALAAQSWFGYGRWEAPYWFIGMEPGGDEEHPSYDAWLDIDPKQTGLIDCYAHHMNFPYPSWRRWHSGDVPPIQPTWGPLIRTMLALLGRSASNADVSRYQRDEWGRLSGETAVIELSALHAKNLSVDVERTLHRDERIERIQREMLFHKPKVALFFGTSYRSEYERIAGQFVNGWTWCGDTLCALVQHPAYRFAPRGEYWMNLGRWLKAAVEVGPRGAINDMPAAQTSARSGTMRETRKKEATFVEVGEEFEILRNGEVVGRVRYDGLNLRVERRDGNGGFELVGYYERSQPSTVKRKIVEIDDVFDAWSRHRSANPEFVKVNWREAPFVRNFNPPAEAIRKGCSVVEDGGLEIGRVYKVAPNRAVWKDANC